MNESILSRKKTNKNETLITLEHIPGMQPQEKILEHFTPKGQEVLEERREILKTIVGAVSGNYSIPVVLGLPERVGDSGWRHVKLKDGREFIQLNADDILSKEMDFLRFVTAHEAGHQAITKFDFIFESQELTDLYAKTTGFAYLLNCTEDPRDNNYVLEVYEPFGEVMKLAYCLQEDYTEDMLIEIKKKMGFMPRHILAGMEYIQQWYRESQALPFAVNSDLPEDVYDVVTKTLPYAKDSWWRFPSKEEVVRNPDIVYKYARVYFDINLKKIWPEFSKLVEKDKKDQRVQEMMKKMGREQKSQEIELPPWLKEVLNEEDQELFKKILREYLKMLKKAEQADEEELLGNSEKKQEDLSSEEGGGKGENEAGSNKGYSPEESNTENTDFQEKDIPFDLDQLPDELKDKLNEGIDKNMDPEEREELEKESDKVMKGLNEEVIKKIQDQTKSETKNYNERKMKREIEKTLEENRKKYELLKERMKKQFEEVDKQLEEADKQLESLNNKLDYFNKKTEVIPDNKYQKARQENFEIVKKLENDLRMIFKSRREGLTQKNLPSGPRINMFKRIQEKARGISVMESRAYERKSLPLEKDYAITLLVDLSGSMDNKIEETFAGVVAVTESLHRLGIKTEILGFNQFMFEYKKFNEKMSNKIQDKMGQMIDSVSQNGSSYNSDGYAVLTASDRLKKNNEKEKILIIFSDGQPAPAPEHRRDEYDLEEVVEKTLKEKKIKLVGVGLGAGTSHVSHYYPKSAANIPIHDLPKQLATVIRQVIEEN